VAALVLASIVGGCETNEARDAPPSTIDAGDSGVAVDGSANRDSVPDAQTVDAGRNCDISGRWRVEHSNRKLPSPIVLTIAKKEDGTTVITVEGAPRPECSCELDGVVVNQAVCSVHILHHDTFVPDPETPECYGEGFDLQLTIEGARGQGTIAYSDFELSCTSGLDILQRVPASAERIE
jgi:hypothetical protein